MSAGRLTDSHEPWPIVAVDGVFFQFNCTGIARVWTSLLREWSRSGFARHLILLDRGGTAPQIPGIESIAIDPYDYNQSGLDAQRLQSICDRLGADLFTSTYYTTPLTTPSVLMVHDMIPEVLQFDLKEPCWREKRYSILHASRYIAVSENTARDLLRFHPHLSRDRVEVIANGVSEDFYPATADEIEAFQRRYHLANPYFLLVGSRSSEKNYKNASLFFQALSQFPHRREIAVLCVGGESQLEPELAALTDGTPIHLLSLSDGELRAAYSGAIALIYPSRYEGFGLPIAEAMACGCPVITCPNSSLPEVGGEAVLYVDAGNPQELLAALEAIQEPEIRHKLTASGFERVKKFSWQAAATTIAELFLRTARENRQFPQTFPIWEEFRSLQAQLQQHPLQPPSLPGEPPIAETSSRERLAPRSFWIPSTSLIGGVWLLVLANSAYLSHLGLPQFPWLARVQDNFSFILGTNCLSIALLLGIVGYFSRIDGRILRGVRIIFASVGLFSIAPALLAQL